MTARSAFDIIQEEVDAFNAGDLERFLALFTADIVVEGLASADGVIAGAQELREQYGRRMAQPGIAAQIVSRVAFGSWLIDYEFVTTDAGVVPQLAIYELKGEKIAHITILRPNVTDEQGTVSGAAG